MRMTKEVFIANGKFYLENPFKKNNKQNETVGKLIVTFTTNFLQKTE